MTKDSLIKLLRQRKTTLGTWKAVADSLGVTPQYIQDIKDGRREPGKILLDALGMVRVVEYRKATKRELESDSVAA